MTNENEKKYVSLKSLQTFKENLDNTFATKTTMDELSVGVAYINVEDNVTLYSQEDIEEAVNTAVEDIDTLIGGDS